MKMQEKVVIGVVTNGQNVLIVKRKQREGNLFGNFPVAVLNSAKLRNKLSFAVEWVRIIEQFYWTAKCGLSEHRIIRVDWTRFPKYRNWSPFPHKKCLQCRRFLFYCVLSVQFEKCRKTKKRERKLGKHDFQILRPNRLGKDYAPQRAATARLWRPDFAQSSCLCRWQRTNDGDRRLRLCSESIWALRSCPMPMFSRKEAGISEKAKFWLCNEKCLYLQRVMGRGCIYFLPRRQSNHTTHVLWDCAVGSLNFAIGEIPDAVRRNARLWWAQGQCRTTFPGATMCHNKRNRRGQGLATAMRALIARP